MGEFTIAHMYPDLMNLYGDSGNLICLQKRIEWSGHICKIVNIRPNQNIDYKGIDMIFIGGGSDREQRIVCQDLLKDRENFSQAIETGVPVLCICGAYQLLGTTYRSIDGQLIKGLGLLDFYTIGNPERLIGNILIETQILGETVSVVGFENHCGRTYFEDPGLQPFGKVVKGYGNNGEDSTEGIRYKNLVGTYLHGPLLPKNPAIADFFIKTMAARKEITIEKVLDDHLEIFAHNQIKERLLR